LVGGDSEIGGVLDIASRGLASLLDGGEHSLFNEFALLAKLFDEWARGFGGVRHFEYS
jgi:hypothetical protein